MYYLYTVYAPVNHNIKTQLSLQQHFLKVSLFHPLFSSHFPWDYTENVLVVQKQPPHECYRNAVKFSIFSCISWVTCKLNAPFLSSSLLPTFIPLWCRSSAPMSWLVQWFFMRCGSLWGIVMTTLLVSSSHGTMWLLMRYVPQTRPASILKQYSVHTPAAHSQFSEKPPPHRLGIS